MARWLRHLLPLLLVVLYLHQATEDPLDKLQRPNFRIQAVLTEEAEQWIKQSNDAIQIRVDFADEIGPGGLYLASEKLQTKQGRIIDVKDIRFDAKLARLLPNRDYEVLVNMGSSRQKDDRHYLSCDILQERITTLQGRTWPIPCALHTSTGPPFEPTVKFTGEVKTKEFMSRCSSAALSSPKARDRENAAFCGGMLKGAILAHEIFVNSDDHPIPRHFCIPPDVSDLTFTTTVIKFMETEPGYDYSLGNGLLAALHLRYPCHEQRTRGG